MYLQIGEFIQFIQTWVWYLNTYLVLETRAVGRVKT